MIDKAIELTVVAIVAVIFVLCLCAIYACGFYQGRNIK